MKFENLKKLRESLGMTQEEFAASLDVNKTTYNNYENGTRDPRSSFWKKVAIKYHVTIDYLLGLVSEPAVYIGDNRTMEEINIHEGSSQQSPDIYHIACMLSKSEQEYIIKYRSLDDYGRETVNTIIEREYQRCEKSQKDKGDIDREKIRAFLQAESSRSEMIAFGAKPQYADGLTEEDREKIREYLLKEYDEE